MTAAADLAAPPRALPRRRTSGEGGTVVPGEAAPFLEDWAALADTACDDNAFFHPDFVLPAIAAFGNRRVSIATVYANGRLVAAAPFTRTRLGGLAPAARLWSHKYGPLGVPLLDADNVDEAAAGLLAELSPPRSSRCVMVPDIPLDSAAAAALAWAARASRRSAAIVSRQMRAIAVRGGALYDPDARLSHHRRHECGRLLRRLGEAGELKIEVAAEEEPARARFEEFLTLEGAGWKGKSRTALVSEPQRLAFARRAIAARAAAGALRVHSIRLDDRAVASLVSFVSGSTAFTWKIAYDENFARFSPGAQVMLAALGGLFTEPHIGRIDSCAAPNHTLADPLLPDRMAIGTFVISPAGEGSIYRAGLAATRLEVAAMDGAKRLRNRFR